MKTSLRLLFTFLVVLWFQSMAQAQHKVVIQLNTADTAAWSSTIGNIKNLQKIFSKL